MNQCPCKMVEARNLDIDIGTKGSIQKASSPQQKSMSTWILSENNHQGSR